MTHKPNYIDAIIVLDPNAKCIYQNEDLSTLVWEDGNPNNITEKQITDKHAELVTAYNNKKYQRDRAEEYPSIVDQLDDIYHNGIDGWKATIKTTKDKYPK
tara:strand:- start:63 stop:365 length:303 start_codon:yes stop_codon:yes gene_type:complete